MSSRFASSRIPSAIIGALSEVMPDELTHANIDSLFLSAGAPDEVPGGSKPQKVQAWLRLVNQLSKEPLSVLGQILEGFMDLEGPKASPWDSTEDQAETFHQRRQRVRTVLAKDGLQYSRGGIISKATGTPVQSLIELVQQDGHSHVNAEMQRALFNLDNDPPAACHAAASILEAVFKTYLDRFGIGYGDSDTLAPLWKQVSENMRIKPGELDDEDVRKIASGLHSIAQGMQGLRNRKSAAHGRSITQMKTFLIKTKHARLAVHSAHSLAIYVLDTISESGGQ